MFMFNYDVQDTHRHQVACQTLINAYQTSGAIGETKWPPPTPAHSRITVCIPKPSKFGKERQLKNGLKGGVNNATSLTRNMLHIFSQNLGIVVANVGNIVSSH